MLIRINNFLNRFRRDDKGVTLVEYGIGLVLAVTVGTFLLSDLGDEVLGEMADACGILASTSLSSPGDGTATACAT